MAFDGLVLAAVARELRQAILSGRIDKVQQPSADDLVLTVRANRQNVRLLLSANRTYPRAHLTTRFSAPSPSAAPPFCMLLRKHLEGGRIVRIEQKSRERILWIDVETRDELGDLAVRRIVLEIMGRHSNLILLDRPDGQILDAISHVPSAVNRHREVLPGREYVPPPEQQKTDPFLETRDGYLEKRGRSGESPFPKYLVSSYLGVSPFFAEETAFHMASGTSVGSRAEREWIYFADRLEEAKTAAIPTIVRDERGGNAAFYLFPPAHLPGRRETFPSVNDCVDAYYSERAMTDILRAKTSSYHRLMRQEKDRAWQRAQKFQAVLDGSENAEKWRVAGEILTAYAHLSERGRTFAVLPNFYDSDAPLTIELDPAKNFLENAAAYFRRYQKYKKGLAVTREQLERARIEWTYADSVLHELENCRFEQIPAIEAELREAGYLRAELRPAASRRRPSAERSAQALKPSYATYRASDGTPIWVGRNNRENDWITLKAAKKTDVWLHVHDAPGSHVIVPHPSPSEESLHEAALLAAHFSRLRDAAKAPVDVVEVKNIHKPAKAPPGFVIFTGQRTLMVSMDRQKIEELLAGGIRETAPQTSARKGSR